MAVPGRDPVPAHVQAQADGQHCEDKAGADREGYYLEHGLLRDDPFLKLDQPDR
jgi:hypothetical protein